MTAAITETRINWSAAAIAGLMGGAVFLALDMVLVPIFTGSSGWAPPRLIAAIVLGREVLPPPATFSASIMLTALIVHLLLSTVYGLAISMLIHRAAFASAVLLGAMAGLALYVLNFYVFTSFFPWFAAARTWVTVFVHLIFGFVVGWGYATMASAHRPRHWR